MKSADIESLLDSLGKPGKLQCISFLFLCINLCIVMTNHMSSVFFTAKTDYSCKIDRNVTGSVEGNNCYVSSSNGSVKCTAWSYNLPDGETTIISEFDLVCDDAYKSDLATTVYFAGVMIGGVAFGILADKYGRKRVVIVTLFLSGIVGVVTFLLRTFSAYIVLRFSLGFFMQGVQNSSFILALETLPMKYRATGGLVFVMSGGVGVLFLDFLSYLIRDWKYVQLSTGVLPFLQLLPMWHILGSLRWNIVQKNFREANAIIQRTVTFNKLDFPKELFDRIRKDDQKHEQQEHKGNIIDVFKSPKLRKISFILFLSWFSFSTGYYGLAFHISHLFGSKYLNLAVSSILDSIVVSSFVWIVPRYGRRRPLIVCFFICCVANTICSLTVSRFASGSAKYVGTAMALIGKTSIACCGAVGYIFTSELYPTVVRNVSLGMNTFWTRVGGMAAPQIFFLAIYVSSFVPYTILAVLTFINACLTILLPETSNKALTDRLEISMSSLLDQKEDLISSTNYVRKIECHETSV